MKRDTLSDIYSGFKQADMDFSNTFRFALGPRQCWTIPGDMLNGTEGASVTAVGLLRLIISTLAKP